MLYIMMINNIIGLIIILFVLYIIYNRQNREKFIDETIDDNFAGQDYMLNPEESNIVCSRSCCAKTWPTGIEVDDTIYGVKPSDIGTKFTSSDQFCTDGYTEGCVCKNIEKI